MCVLERTSCVHVCLLGVLETWATHTGANPNQLIGSGVLSPTTTLSNYALCAHMRVCPCASTCAVSHEDLFKVGAAIFNLHKAVGDGAVRAAAPFIELSSEAGNTDARYTLAQLLRTGRGMECNVVRAASLFQELAMKAHPYAQVGHGMVHGQRGAGVCRKW